MMKARAARTGRPIPIPTPRAIFEVVACSGEGGVVGGVSDTVELEMEDVVLVLEEGE